MAFLTIWQRRAEHPVSRSIWCPSVFAHFAFYPKCMRNSSLELKYRRCSYHYDRSSGDITWKHVAWVHADSWNKQWMNCLALINLSSAQNVRLEAALYLQVAAGVHPCAMLSDLTFLCFKFSSLHNPGLKSHGTSRARLQWLSCVSEWGEKKSETYYSCI